MKSLFYLILSCIILLHTGCTYKVATPSSRWTHSDGPTAAKETTIQFESYGVGEVFGPNLAGGGLSIRLPQKEKEELSIRLNYTGVEGSNEVEEQYYVNDSKRKIWSANFGKAKQYSLLGNVLLSSGFGFGSNYFGKYVSVDGSVNWGYDNRYVVPSMSLGLFGSLPFNTKRVPGDSYYDDIESFVAPTAYHRNFAKYWPWVGGLDCQLLLQRVLGFLS